MLVLTNSANSYSFEPLFPEAPCNSSATSLPAGIEVFAGVLDERK